MDVSDQETLVQLTADIVSAYVANNQIGPEELASLIGDVHTALQKAPNGAAEAKAEPQEPAVAVRRSVTPDYVICLEDGKKFKSLKRHLRTAYNMTPEEYRAKWGLRPDYPMVAPNYAKARSELAKTMGLGQKRLGRGAEQAPAPAKRGRRARAK